MNDPDPRYVVHPFRAGCKLWLFKVRDTIEQKYVGPNHRTEAVAQKYADRRNNELEDT